MFNNTGSVYENRETVQKALEFEKTDGTHLKSSTYALVFDFIDTYMHLRY
jgi:hypothetical protein